MKSTNKYFNFFISLYILQILLLFIKSNILNLPYPFDTFNFTPSNIFGDWNSTIKSSSQSNPYIWDFTLGNPAYFPFNYLFFKVLNYFELTTISFFITINYLFFIISFIKLSSFLKFNKQTLLIIMILLSHPVIFSIDRGSTDFISFSAILLFLLLYLNKKFTLASLLLPIFAFKGYQMIYALLFFKKGEYKYFFLSVFYFLLLNIFSLIIFEGNLIDNLNYFLKALETHKHIYLLDKGSLHFYYDFFNFIRAILIFNDIPFSATSHLFYYHLFSLIFSFLVFIYIFKKKEIDIPYKLLLLTFILIIFPDAANIYKGVYFLVPLILLINKNDNEDKFIIYLLLILIVPKNYWTLEFNGLQNNIDCLINPITLLVLIVVTFLRLKKF